MFRSGKHKMNPETIILKQIKQFLEISGFFVYRNQQNIGSLKGISDLTVLRKDMPAIFIEVKTATGKLSERQEWFRDQIEKAGHLYIVARSIDDVRHLRATNDQTQLK